jgi:flagellar export protein FliJ
MSEFKFQLQRLLDMRREKVKEIERIIEERYRAREKLRAILLEQRDLYFGERSELNACLKAGDLIRIPTFESSLDLRKAPMMELLENIKEVEADIDFLESALVQGRREVKSVEKIYEKRHSEWRHQEEMNERKLIDEMATLRHLQRERMERIEEME